MDEDVFDNFNKFFKNSKNSKNLADWLSNNLGLDEAQSIFIASAAEDFNSFAVNCAMSLPFAIFNLPILEQFKAFANAHFDENSKLSPSANQIEYYALVFAKVERSELEEFMKVVRGAIGGEA